MIVAEVVIVVLPEGEVWIIGLQVTSWYRAWMDEAMMAISMYHLTLKLIQVVQAVLMKQPTH